MKLGVSQSFVQILRRTFYLCRRCRSSRTLCHGERLRAHCPGGAFGLCRHVDVLAWSRARDHRGRLLQRVLRHVRTAVVPAAGEGGEVGGGGGVHVLLSQDQVLQCVEQIIDDMGLDRIAWRRSPTCSCCSCCSRVKSWTLFLRARACDTRPRVRATVNETFSTFPAGFLREGVPLSA